MKRNVDKIGYPTSKIHDCESNKLAKDRKFLRVKRILCLSNSQGIHGFFPYFTTPEDDKINSKNFHSDFFKTHMPELEKKEKPEEKLVREEIFLSPREVIRSIVLVYEEDPKKITAIKVKTNLGSYVFGNKPKLNNLHVSLIHKDYHFIPGWKTSYILEDGVPYLSYLQVYYEDASFLGRYFNQKPPSKLYIFCRKKVKQLLNILYYLALLFIILGIVISPVIYYLYASQNIYGGEYRLSNKHLKENVLIHTDNNGFAHIKAENNEDAFFGLGFTHAKERLWQMDFMRRFNNGKLSEVLGDKAVKVDIMMRKLGLKNFVEKKIGSFKKSKFINIVNKYVEGINYFAENNYLPIEYHIFGIKFDKWLIDDCLAVASLFSWVHTQDWRMEVWYKLMEDNLGKEFADLVVSFRDKGFKFDRETIINDEELELLNLGLGVRAGSKPLTEDERISMREERRKKYRRDRRKIMNIVMIDDKEKEKVEEVKVKQEKKVIIEENQESSNNQSKITEKKQNTSGEEELNLDFPEDPHVVETNNIATDQSLSEGKIENTIDSKEVIKDKESEKSNQIFGNATQHNTQEQVNQNQQKKESNEENNDIIKDFHFKKAELDKKVKITEPESGEKIPNWSGAKTTRRRQTEKKRIYEAEKNTLDLDFPSVNEGASNNWVISGDFTESGKPILSNDPHVENTMPSSFFINKIYLPNITISGTTVPGLPIFTTGSNNYLSWGITTENTDTADLCEEKIEGDFYIYDDKKIKLDTTQEIIHVKGQEKPVTVEIKWTRNGPLIDNILNDALKLNSDFTHYTPLSLRIYWTKFDYTPEMMFKLMFSKTKDEFVDDIEKFTAPNLNFVFAGINGDIGYYQLGFIPIKKTIRSGFCQGFNPEDEIIRHVKREESLRLINPDKGFIVTANNKMASSNYKFNFPGFHNNIRATRIRQLIERKIENEVLFTVKDNVEIMQDVKDLYAEEILPKVLLIVKKNGGKDLPYFNELSNWDFEMRKDSIIPTVYSMLEYKIANLLVTIKNPENDLSNGILSMLHFFNFMEGIIDKMAKGEIIELKKCALHTGSKNCEKLILHVFQNLDTYLNEFKTDDKSLYWGNAKSNYYKHYPFEANPTLRHYFGRNIATGGSRNTVKISRGNFSNKKGFKDIFKGNHSPSVKFVCDLSDITQPYIISDTGNSGKVTSKFYDNLMHKSEEGRLIKFVNHNFNEESDLNTILLRVK